MRLNAAHKACFDDNDKLLTKKECYEVGDLVRVYMNGFGRNVRSGNEMLFYTYDLIKKEKIFNNSVSVPIENICVVIGIDMNHSIPERSPYTYYILMWDNKFFLCSYNNIFNI